MITEKDLELEYLRDTGNQLHNYKTEEVEDTYTPKEVSDEVTCPECEATFREIMYPEDEVINTEISIEAIDEDFHKWCIEELLKYKNNEKNI